MTWTVPGYVAEELLGFGSSGEVWRARGAVTGEVVALKRLRAGREPAEHERLRREAAVLAAFEHPHVVRLDGVLWNSGGPVLVLEYAAGGSLAGFIARRGPCSAGELIGLLEPVAGALAAAHEFGLVHGDVSSANILLGTGGRPLLADLGTARLLADGPGPAFGTAGFVDPAISTAAAGQAPGPAADVYGLAAVAVHALTGSVATSDPAGALSGVAAPEALLRVLRQALHADPAARPSAATLARRLSDAGAAEPLADHGGPARAAAVEPATAQTHAVDGALRCPAPAGEPGRHRRSALRSRLALLGWRGAVRLAAAVLLAAVAAGSLGWGGPTGKPPRALPGRPAAGPQPGRAAQPGVPASPVSWAQVWAALDARRARAFATADAMLLDQVYLAGCAALPLDLRAVRSLAARHAHATGVEHHASSVRPESLSGDLVTLAVVDSMPGYDVRDAAGRVVAHHPPRGDRPLRVRLARTGRGWRIAELSSPGG